MSKDTGGPAYPNPNDVTATGMTLRDYFAGQALAGWMADDGVKVEGSSDAFQIAKKCYLLADAMLKAQKV